MPMQKPHKPLHSLQLARAALAMLLILASMPGHTNIWPTESEWATWPEFCRVRYVDSAIGRDSEFSARIDPNQISSWETRLGDAWYGLHHHCAALVYMDRASLERDPAKRNWLLHKAIGEHTFTLNRTSKANPMHAEIATKIGMTHRSLGERTEAVRYFDMAIAEQPTYAGAYQGKAMLLRDLSQFEKARDTLLDGNKATEGKSPELQYFLGLVLFDMKDFDTAREHARLAYELGYPLPGLRDKLAHAGYPL